MAPLVYSPITSLDGYTEDASGSFDWAAPDEEVHAFVNDRERSIGTYLYGRRMYETMRFWEHPDAFADESATVREYAAIWQAADKVVYSRTLQQPSTARTRLEAEFHPDAVRKLKADADRPISVGGPELAAAAFRAGLVDEVALFLTPVMVGGGKPALPSDVRLGLDLAEVHRFAHGAVYLRYTVRSA
jgi:dihydrofolate reductase